MARAIVDFFFSCHEMSMILSGIFYAVLASNGWPFVKLVLLCVFFIVI